MISVVIPTYNESCNMERCLSTLSNQSIARGEYEIIVVDGKSKDATVEIAKRYADRIVFQKSSGIAGARNDGVRSASGSIIATTDADAIVPPFWLERIRSYFEDPGVVGVVGPVEPIEVSPKSRALFRLGNLGQLLTYRLSIIQTPGNNCAFRKDAFLNAGCFKDLCYNDDIEMGLRLRKMGKIAYDPHIKVKVSTRRMDKDGYLRTLMYWIKGEMLVLLCGNVEYRKYARKEP